MGKIKYSANRRKVILIRREIKYVRRSLKIAKRMGHENDIDQLNMILEGYKKEEERKQNQALKRRIIDSRVKVYRTKQMIRMLKTKKMSKTKRKRMIVKYVYILKSYKNLYIKYHKYAIKGDIKMAKTKIKRAKRALKRAKRSEKDHLIEKAEDELEYCIKYLKLAKKGKGGGAKTKMIEVIAEANSDIDAD